MLEYDYDVYAYNVINIHLCVSRKHASGFKKWLWKGDRKIDAQAKATKHQSDKLFLQKEAEARVAECQSDESLRGRETEARAAKWWSHSRMQNRGDREKPRQRRGNIEAEIMKCTSTHRHMHLHNWCNPFRKRELETQEAGEKNMKQESAAKEQWRITQNSISRSKKAKMEEQKLEAIRQKVRIE